MLLLGCGSAPPAQWAADPTNASSYQDQLAQWSRHGEAHRMLDGLLYADATLISPAFALAHAREEAERMGLPTAERSVIEQRQTQEADQGIRFHLSLVTQEPGWNNLDARRPTFLLRLMQGEIAVPPTAIQRLDSTMQDQTAAYFPYVHPMAERYWVSFPKPEQSGDVVLRIAGAPGRVDLRWEIK